MNPEFPFIAVDWGTSRMRAMLCEAGRPSPDAAAVVVGEGVSRLTRSIPETLFGAIEPWVRKHGNVDILMAGMVGSNLGWRTTPYLPCPLDCTMLAANRIVFVEQGHNIAILPGASCENSLGQPDLMRGEELQILGWLSRNRGDQVGDRLLCLPGTHTKWARLSNARLESFTTSLTGELFALLRERSVLIAPGDRAGDKPFEVGDFIQGVDLARSAKDSLLHALFSTRAHSLTNPGHPSDASSYLSGLLIGADVESALSSYPVPGNVIEVIADEKLAEKFGVAIERCGYEHRIWNGDEMVYSGFLSVRTGARNDS